MSENKTHFIGHWMIVGLSGSGKTTLNVLLANVLADNDKPVYVLDPHLESRWEVDFLTDNPDAFLRQAQSTQKSILIIEEAGDMIGHYGKNMNWLATRSRHNGHLCFFSAQRANQIDPTTRNNCRNVIAFEQVASDAKILYENFNCPALLKAPELNPGEAIVYVKGTGPLKIKIF